MGRLDVTSEAKDHCDNKVTCSFNSSIAIEGDPCVGEPKITQLKYMCKPQKGTSWQLWLKFINEITILRHRLGAYIWWQR